jgi:TldD protein
MSIDHQHDGLTRREFMRRSALLGAAAYAGSAAWDAIAGRQALAGSDPALPGITALLTRDQVTELLKRGLSRGGDFAEVYAEYTLITALTVDQGKLSTMEYGVLAGAGIRVLAGDEMGYAYSDDFDMAHLRSAAVTAATIASRGAAGVPKAYRVSGAKPPFTLKSPAPLSLSERQKIDLLLKGDAAARGVDKRITQVTAVWQDTARRLLVANSDGTFETDEQYVSRLVYLPLAVDGTNRQSSFVSTGGCVEADFYTTDAAEALARKGAGEAVELLSAVEPRAGTYPVVIAPGWGGVLAHECFGHSLEGDGIRKHTSIRATQLGTQVAAKGVNIYDDGTVPHSRGSFRVDDEGTPARKNLVVEDGVLRGYLWDRLSLKYADAALT